MERGWVGRVDGDRVVHLAAQTLQHFFSGGARAREHAEYALPEVTFVVPVLHPPSVRVFESQTAFAFANPAAMLGPGSNVVPPADELAALPRLAGVVGADGAVGGFSALLELRAPALDPPKDRDFALVLGPVVVTPDELLVADLDAVVSVDGCARLRGTLAGFDWEAARSRAAANTVLRTGDLLAGPPLGEEGPIGPGAGIELDVAEIGTLAVAVAG